MLIALPPLNHWQCFVVDRSNVVLQVQSSSNIIAYEQVRRQCRADSVFCDINQIICRFNGPIRKQACWVRDELGYRWMSQNSYDPCGRAKILCQQAHNFAQRTNLHCFVFALSRPHPALEFLTTNNTQS